jgi:2,4-dienoyl-CoA reductase-like NADH-dependent reductase (Old Yellow Enzyme family)
MPETMSKLYTPITIGSISPSQRIARAPLPRFRSEQPADVPGDVMTTHYGPRLEARAADSGGSHRVGG